MYIIRRIFRWISFAIIFFLVSSVSAVVGLKWLFIEIESCHGFHAIDAVTHLHGVEIHFHNQPS